MEDHKMYSQWPESQPYLKPLLCVYYTLVTSVITCCIISRASTVFPDPVQKIRKLSLARAAILALLFDSWLIAFTSTFLVFGLELAAASSACSAAIWLCIILYSFSKFFIYIFLMERIYVVHTSRSTTNAKFADRFGNTWYNGACIFMLGWLAVFILALQGRSATPSHIGGECHIGISTYAMIPGLVLDGLFSLYLLAGFLMPLYKSGYLEMRSSRAMAKSASIACFVCLLTSGANLTIIAVFDGHLPAYTCLTACLSDIVFCAFVFFLVTRPRAADEGTLISEHGTVLLSNQPVNGPTIAYSDLPTASPRNGVHVLPFSQGSAFMIDLHRDSEARVELDEKV